MSDQSKWLSILASVASNEVQHVVPESPRPAVTLVPNTQTVVHITTTATVGVQTTITYATPLAEAGVQTATPSAKIGNQTGATGTAVAAVQMASPVGTKGKRNASAITTENEGGTQRKRVRGENPVCADPLHDPYRSSEKAKQRHICRQCAQNDLDRLRTVPNLTPWDVVCVMNILFRSYFCGICLLEEPSHYYPQKDSILSASRCSKHSVYNSQHTCYNHRQVWNKCHTCLHEFRAGTWKCQLCGGNFRCACPRGPIAMLDTIVSEFKGPQPEEQITLKNELVANTLAYAKALQEAEDDPVRIQSLVASRPAPVMRPKSIFELRSETAARDYAIRYRD